jgi:hypothetical protein
MTSDEALSFLQAHQRMHRTGAQKFLCGVQNEASFPLAGAESDDPDTTVTAQSGRRTQILKEVN